MGKKTVTVVGAKLKKLALRLDGWSNPFTGLGTSRDKASYNTYTGEADLTAEEADALYSSDDMAALICDIMPEEALRQGLTVKAPDNPEAERLLNSRVKDLDIVAKVSDAFIWGNVFGAGVIILGVIDGVEDLTEPLRVDKVTDFKYINVIDKRYISPAKWYRDPMSSNYGRPETYNISITGSGGSESVLEIHESRLIIAGGVRTSLKQKQGNDGWDISLLQRVNTTLRQFGIGWASLSHLMLDANQGVFKMQGLIDALAEDEQEVIAKRLTLMDMSRSTVRALVLDAETEDFDKPNFSWSGIEKPFELLMYRLAAATRIPVAILMGRSPAGMNATGDSDFRAFYDRVKSFRANRIEPVIQRLVELIAVSEGLKVDWYIDYPPLWQPTPKEEAEIRKLQSETDRNYIDAAVLLPEEVAISRFTKDGWSPETALDDTARPEGS